MPVKPDMYRAIRPDSFPAKIGMTFYFDEGPKEVLYEKVQWDGKGLRYGDNPDQSAAWYRRLPQGSSTAPQDTFTLLRAAKHPSKNNIADLYSAGRVLRYFPHTAAAVVVKHGNPCGAALAERAEEAFLRAHAGDRIAAFGGVAVVNREITESLARYIADHFFEIVAAPGFTAAAREILYAKKSLSLFETHDAPTEDAECLMLSDGSLLFQSSFLPKILDTGNAAPAEGLRKEKNYTIARAPGEDEIRDMRFGWILQSAVSSNSVLFVKDQRSLGIATGEQDRVGAACIARDKAYRNAKEGLAYEQFQSSFGQLPDDAKQAISLEVDRSHAGLEGSVMISDGFFPFRDGVDVGLKEGVRAVLQPGGSIRDYESILACNEAGATMVFTGQRGFRH